MKIFKNLFNCVKGQSENELKIQQHKSDIELIKRDIRILYDKSSSFTQDIKRLEDKLDNKFDMLNIKIDNILVLLNRNRN